jgi:uncharacterized beta-barrel protein YwiB (DUF1934 family)
MRRNAKITIHGNDASCTVRGTWERTAEGWRLAYDEPEAAGMGAVRTELTLSDGAARLTRSGAVRSELCLDPGAPHASLYETPYGSFPAAVVTHALRGRLNERGGLFEARYTLTLGGAADERRLRIRIQTEEDT